MSGHQTEGSISPKIVRGRVDSLTLYEVTESELQVLEEGSPSSIYLNFAIFFLSVALSFLATLLTSTPRSTATLVVFLVLVAVGSAAGAVLLVLWYRTRKQVAKVIRKIKARCVVDLPEGPATPPPPPTPPGPTEASAG